MLFQNHYTQQEPPERHPSEGMPSLVGAARDVRLLMVVFVHYARLLCPLIPALLIALLRGYGLSGGRPFDWTWTYRDVNVLYAFSCSWEACSVSAIYCLSLALLTRRVTRAILSGAVFVMLTSASIISAAAVHGYTLDVLFLSICHVCELAPALLLPVPKQGWSGTDGPSAPTTEPKHGEGA
jgi:hypothetical protein